MRKPATAILWTAVLAATSLGRTGPGDAPTPDTEATKERLGAMQRQAAEYEARRVAAPSAALELHPEPLLRWDNPVSGVKDGCVFLWTDGGRPLAMLTLFLNRDSVWVHEFQQLSDVELAAERDGVAVWTPKAAGIEMMSRQDVGAPAATKAARLRQMRVIAEEYAASVRFGGTIGGAEPTDYELRLLPRPIYRYGGPDGDVIDGGLFAFVQGTNPEVLLVLEARRRGDAGGEWRCGFAPMTGYAVSVSRDGTPVWSLPDRLPKKKPTDPFFALLYGPESP